MPQDFSGQNLRGRSFKGQELAGANFSNADIRGADFTRAKLMRANFTGARAGLQYYHSIGLFLFSFFLLLLSELISATNSSVMGSLLTAKYAPDIFAGQLSLITSVFFFIATIRQGLELVLGWAIVWVVGVAASWAVALSIGVDWNTGWGLTSIAITTGIGAVSWIYACALTGTVAWTLTNNATWLVVVAGTLVWTAAKFNLWSGVGVVAGGLVSYYIGWRALAEDKKFAIARWIAIALTAGGGTSFRGANLTDVNFTEAILKSTDFRKANLTRACFYKTKKLDRVRPGTTYLQKAQVVRVLVTGQVQEQDKIFDSEDLRGVNFQGANLVDASFIGTNLSQANLQDADLSRAKLKQTQLDATDFTGATLTGAFIEDWGITTNTKFNGVRCEYVYMRLPTEDNPEPIRKPDNHKEVFADGEFGDFIKPIFDTLDLYHNQDVDPRAIAISFKELAQNHPEAELEIVAMEKRGQDKFLLRAKTAATAEKSQLSAEYFSTYNEIKGLPERKIKLLLAEKDNQIRRLENMVMTALERPSFYSNIQVEEVGTMTNNPGGFSVGGSVGGDIRNVQGDNNRTVQGDNNQVVQGDNNQVTQQNQLGGGAEASLTKDDIIKLLAELETLIRGAEIPAEPKEEVIEDLSAAKNATDKEEPNKTRALARLDSVAETLEKTSKTVDSGKKLWSTAKPIIVKIAGWLGAAAGSHLLGL